MYGAILGDVIGSPFEFDRGDKTKDFELFTEGCNFTDDSIMTIAIAEALLAVGSEASVADIEEAVIANMQDWGRRYPYAGYGSSFRHWLTDYRPKPYGSYGNGSAMRVSAAGWLYSTIERTREVAEATAKVTHNHPEGIKGAVATASCIFLARNGATKEEIKHYVECEFEYDLDRTLAEIRPTYYHVESCQKTVPEAIIAFLEATDFEDAVRNAVSLGGDTDTLAAITGSIAEAYFGIPAILKAACRSCIDDCMLQVLEAFDEALDRNVSDAEGGMLDNKPIEKAIDCFYLKQDKEGFEELIITLCYQIKNGAYGLVPFVTMDEDMLSDLDVYSLKEGDTFTLDHDVRIRMDTVIQGKDDEWLYIFTNSDELHKGRVPDVSMEIPFIDMFEIANKTNRVKGVVINPFGKYLKLDKQIIECIFTVLKNIEDETYDE